VKNMIRSSTIILYYCCWLIIACLLVSYKSYLINIIKIYPFATLIYIFILSVKYERDIKNYLKNSDNSLYKEVFSQSPLVNNFSFIKFVFTPSRNLELQKAKNTGKILYVGIIILFISIVLVSIS
jgi:hypothetical protein